MLRTSQKGLSLVEVIIGVAMLIIVFGASMVGLQLLTRGSTNSRVNFKVEQRLQTVSNEIRMLAITNFQTMTSSTPLHSDNTYPLKSDAFVYISTPRINSSDFIQVQREISDIDSSMMTRKVTLTAYWYIGKTLNVQQITFDIGKLQGKAAGASIVVYVYDGITSLPIDGVKVVTQSEDTDNNPTQSKYVTCKTNDQIPGTGKRISGTCQLDHVRLIDNLQLTVDGNPLGSKPVAYFHSDPLTSSALDEVSSAGTSSPDASFSQALNVSPALSPNESRQISVKMYKTAGVTGFVFDDDDSSITPSGVVVELRKRPGKQVIESSLKYVTSTDNGMFNFSNVIPGEYSLHIIGSYDYVGVGYPNDDNDSADSTSYPTLRTVKKVLSGTLLALTNNRTIKRGSIQYKVSGLAGDGVGGFVATSNPTPSNPASIQYKIERTTSCYDTGPTCKDETNTLPNKGYYSNPSAPGFPFKFSTIASPVSSGAPPSSSPTPTPSSMMGSLFYFQNIAPSVVTKTITGTAVNTDSSVGPAIIYGKTETTVTKPQYSNLTFYSDLYQTPPFVPVLAIKINTAGALDKNNLKFASRWVEYWNQTVVDETYSPALAPRGVATLQDFKFKVYTNNLTAASNKNHEYYLLEESALSNVTGNILSGGVAFDDAALNVPGGFSGVRVLTSGGWGGVVRHPTTGKNFIASQYAVESNHFVAASGSTPATHTYSLARTHCTSPTDAAQCLGVLPNLGTDSTTIIYSGWPYPTTPIEKIKLMVVAVQKKRDYTQSGNPIIQLNNPAAQVPSASTNISSLPVETKPEQNIANVENGNISVAAGLPGASPDFYFQRTTILLNYYTGSTTVTLTPGPPAVTADINVTNTPYYSRMYIQVPNSAKTDPTSDYARWDRGEAWDVVYVRGADTYYRRSLDGNTMDTPLYAIKKINAKVSGTVQRQNLTPLKDISLTLSGSGFSNQTVTTDVNGNFSFSAVKAVPIDTSYNPNNENDDLIVTATDPNKGFETLIIPKPLYNAYNAPTYNPTDQTGEQNRCVDADALGDSCIKYNISILLNEIGTDKQSL